MCWTQLELEQRNRTTSRFYAVETASVGAVCLQKPTKLIHSLSILDQSVSTAHVPVNVTLGPAHNFLQNVRKKTSF